MNFSNPKSFSDLSSPTGGQGAMLRNYFKIAIRSLSRNKLFSFITIFGLALSMSVCMMVMLRVKDQLSYDRFHPKGDRVYRILTNVEDKKKGSMKLASTPLPLKEQLMQFPSVVENVVTIYPALHHDAVYKEKAITLNGAFTQPSFFNVFGFRLKEGAKESALAQPNSVVLSAEAASKIFDQEHPIGKVVSVDKLGNFIVTGVLEKKQGKSHLYFDAYVSLSTVPGLENRGIFPRHTNDWSPFEPAYTYVLLKEGVETNQLSAVLSGISSRIYTHTGDKTFAFTQQSLRKITPGSEQLYNDNSRGSGWPKLWTEIGVALLILIAGCFNYTNLTIARALTRAKEVGIRKVAGAVRYQIFLQYIVESICIALFSLGLATILLSFILEYKPFNDGYEFMPDVRMDSTVLLLFFAFSIVTGMLSGAIPAWILSSFNPVEVLKNIRTKKLFGNISLQKTLIVFQFSLSLIIIIFLSSFYKQFSYLATVKHGFRKENIVVLPVYSENKKLLVNELNRISGVEGVAALSGSFGINVSGRVAAASKEETAPIKVNYYYADASVVPVMDLQLVAGENLSESTSDVEEQILLNETAVQALGLESNGNAIGQTIRINDTTNARIKGVVKNFYYQGTGNAIYPLMLRSKEGEYHHLFVHIPSLNDENKIGEIEAVWKKIYPNRTFTYDWLSKQLQADTDQTATISLLGFLALITITIGSLGLLGLVVYTVETRRKEISIRKIIGASVQQLLLLLSKSFIQLLLLAGLIAMPVGYVLCRFFLQNFANRVNFGFWNVLLCFLFLLLIGLITILSQTRRAAVENPSKNLRME